LKDVNAVATTKQSITDIMYVGVEDESLLKYKLSLLQDLPTSVKRATQLGLATPRKLLIYNWISTAGGTVKG
jgi:hypothetical protein